MKKCYCCGADVPDQSKFCPKCGKPMEITQDLLDRARADNPDAQTELYERTYKTVYSRIRAKVPDADTVMDIMQDSYLRAFTNLDQLQKAETFPSWLLTIASRQVCDWYKKNGKEQQNVQMSQLEYENYDTISDEDDLLEMPEYREDFSPDESLDRAETGRLLSEILDTLPEDQRIILTMRYYDEMSLQEISDELGVNLSTVKSRLTAGKKKVETKVLELEKSGTKLYSLGPVAFLVYLLHHAELFAPAISANAVIGMTAAGAAGAGGAAAAHVAAGAAAKTAATAAAKGVGVKIAAIVAAAVVAAGGVTTAVVVSRDSGPSETVIHEMVDPLGFWSVNAMGADAIEAGPIVPSLNQAAELAAGAYYEENIAEDGDAAISRLVYEDGTVSGGYYLPEEELDGYLNNLFGPGFRLSEFESSDPVRIYYDVSEHESAFSPIGNINNSLDLALFEKDGRFYYQMSSENDDYVVPQDVEIDSIEKVDSSDEKYNVTVEYNYSCSDEGSNEAPQGKRAVEYEMTRSEDSDYGWIISKITYLNFTGDVPEPVSGKIQVTITETEGKLYEGAYVTISQTDGDAYVLDENEPGQFSVDVPKGDYCLEIGWGGNSETSEQIHVENRQVTHCSVVLLGQNGKIITTMEDADFDPEDPADGSSEHPIKSLTEDTGAGDRIVSTYDINGNMLTGTGYGDDLNNATNFYDENGNKLAVVSYSPYDLNFLGWTEYLYDSSGNERFAETYDEDGSISSWYENTYDSSGNMLTSEKYDENGILSSRVEYTYDSSGNVLTQNNYGEASRLSSRIEYTYDSGGNVLTEVRYDENGNISTRVENTYDGQGNLLTYAYYGYNYNVFFVEEYTYDDDGNMLTHIRRDADGKISSTTKYTYDSYGNSLFSQYDSDGNLSEWNKLSYDEYGNMLANDSYTGEGRLTYYTYYAYEYYD